MEIDNSRPLHAVDSSPPRLDGPAASPESPSLRALFFVSKSLSDPVESAQRVGEAASAATDTPLGLHASSEDVNFAGATGVGLETRVSVPARSCTSSSPATVVEASTASRSALPVPGEASLRPDAPAGDSSLKRNCSAPTRVLPSNDTLGNFRKDMKGISKVEWSEGASDEEKHEESYDLASRLELHKKLLHFQIEQFQRIVNLQCRLTGSNPLAQELASAVLETKGGKKTGNALTVDALRYLHSVFAVKDTITKKEARDISVQSGATLTQVREFFATQRSQVRVLVQQHMEEAEVRSAENLEDQSQQRCTDTSSEKDIGFSKLNGLESVELLLELMLKEKQFFRQGELLQVVLQTDPGLVLRRFLEKGGLKVLHGWLATAAAEEQTSLLRELLQVLSHLPMSHAIPLQMSALLQPVNKLRFYCVPDVASRARSLMSKWSKLLMSKAKGRRPVASAVPASNSKDTLESSRSVQKREGDAAVVLKGYHPQRKKQRTGAFSAVELLNVHPGGTPRPVKADSIKEVSKSRPGFIAPTIVRKVATEEALKSKPDMMQRTSGKMITAMEVLHSQQGAKPQAEMKPVLDESICRQALSGVTAKLMEASRTSALPVQKVPKARGVSRAASGLNNNSNLASDRKMTGNHVRFPSNFQVSEAASAATAVSRKRPHTDLTEAKEKRKVLPVEDTGAGNRWREASGRRPIVPVDKSSRPLSADEIRKAKLRARIMQLPVSGGFSKALNSSETPQSRGKPSQVGDGWSLDRHTSVEHEGVLAPRQIVDSETFESLLLEQAVEAQVLRPENPSNGRVHSSVATASESGEDSTLPQAGDMPIVYEASDYQALVTSSALNAMLEEVRGPLSPSKSEGSRVESIPKRVLVGDYAVEEGVKPVDITAPNLIEVVLREEVFDPSSMPADKGPEIALVQGNQARIIPWTVPPGVKLDAGWGVAAGDASKEREVQAARVKREEESFYPDLLSIPANPKDLWDEEPSYDDTLTFDIPIEVPQTAESTQSKSSSPSSIQGQVSQHSNSEVTLISKGVPLQIERSDEKQFASMNHATVSQQGTDLSTPGHDPNLLALLLNNPALVSQLTSQQNSHNNLGSLSALLGMVKESSTGGQSAPAFAVGSGDITQSRQGVSTYPVASSHLTGQLQLPLIEQLSNRSSQPQVPVPEVVSLDLGRTLPGSGALESTAEVRGAYITKTTVVPDVPNWEPPRWAPTLPPTPTGGLPPPPQGHPLPLPQRIPVPDHASLLPPTNVAKWQEPAPPSKWPGGPSWPHMNTHVQTITEQFDSQGRPPVVTPPMPSAHAASGMPEVLDVTNVQLVVPRYGQVMHSGVWPPNAPSHANHAPSNVHHNVMQTVNQPFPLNFRGHARWPHTEISHGYQTQNHREFQEMNARSFVADNPSPSWGRPPAPRTLLGAPLPLNNQHWQVHDQSSRPALPPSNPHFSQDSRHQNSPNW